MNNRIINFYGANYGVSAPIAIIDTTDLQFYYPMNDTGFDYPAYKYDLNLTNTSYSAQIESASFSKSMYFDGSGTATSSYSLSESKSISVSLWFRFDSLPNATDVHRNIIQKLWYNPSSSGMDITMHYVSYINTIQVAFKDGSSWYEAKWLNHTLSINTWYHLIGTYDVSDGTVKMYIDGILKATAGPGCDLSTVNTQIGSLSIGYASAFNARFFKGYIDDVCLWHRLLTSTERNILGTAPLYSAVIP